MDIAGILFSATVSLIRDLIFPQPVGDGTLPPPRIVPKNPDLLPPTVAQCPVPYRCVIRSADGTYLGGIYFTGPLTGTFQDWDPQGKTFRQGVETPQGRKGITTTFGARFVHVDLLGFPKYKIYSSSGPSQDFSGNYAEYERLDGQPDDCPPPPIPPPKNEPHSYIPTFINPDSDLPSLEPPKIFPLPPPELIPAPNFDWLPKPEPDGGTKSGPCDAPENCCHLDLNFNLKVENKFDVRFNFNTQTGTGEIKEIPNYLPYLKQITVLAQATYRKVSQVEHRVKRIEKVCDRLFAQEFLHEGTVGWQWLGRVGYDRHSSVGISRPTENLVWAELRLDVHYNQTHYGRRVRKGAPHLTSPESLGYYIYQYWGLGFSPPVEIRTFQVAIPLNPKVLGVYFYLEPPFEGDVYVLLVCPPSVAKFLED